LQTLTLTDGVEGKNHKTFFYQVYHHPLVNIAAKSQFSVAGSVSYDRRRFLLKKEKVRLNILREFELFDIY
jgi:hypothetical protein